MDLWVFSRIVSLIPQLLPEKVGTGLPSGEGEQKPSPWGEGLGEGKNGPQKNIKPLKRGNKTYAELSVIALLGRFKHISVLARQSYISAQDITGMKRG